MTKERMKKQPPKNLPKLDIDLNSEQELGLKIIEDSVITFIDGQAGSGKTLLAIYAALNALHGAKINTIFITRPAVQAGEDQGFLPGELKDKMDPYMQPIYDNLIRVYASRNPKTGLSNVQSYMNSGELQIAPIGYMRGRTFTDSYVILDEAQNITRQQLMMALTRIGKNTKMIICGDARQCDLYKKKAEGIEMLLTLIKRKNIDFLSHVYLNENHRDPIVKALLDEFEQLGY